MNSIKGLFFLALLFMSQRAHSQSCDLVFYKLQREVRSLEEPQLVESLRDEFTHGDPDKTWSIVVDTSAIVRQLFANLLSEFELIVQGQRVVDFNFSGGINNIFESKASHDAFFARPNRQAYKKIGLAAAKLNRIFESLLRRALPGENIRSSGFRLSRESYLPDSFGSRNKHFDDLPEEYIVITVAIDANQLTAKMILEGKEYAEFAAWKGTRFEDNSGKVHKTPTHWAFINSGKGREWEFYQENKSARHWAPFAEDRAVLVFTYESLK